MNKICTSNLSPCAVAVYPVYDAAVLGSSPLGALQKCRDIPAVLTVVQLCSFRVQAD